MEGSVHISIPLLASYQIEKEGVEAGSKTYWGQDPETYPVGTP